MKTLQNPHTRILPPAEAKKRVVAFESGNISGKNKLLRIQREADVKIRIIGVGTLILKVTIGQRRSDMVTVVYVYREKLYNRSHTLQKMLKESGFTMFSSIYARLMLSHVRRRFIFRRDLLAEQLCWNSMRRIYSMFGVALRTSG
jgi:hypothetical protein